MDDDDLQPWTTLAHLMRQLQTLAPAAVHRDHLLRTGAQALPLSRGRRRA